jgi:hypothetical protein
MKRLFACILCLLLLPRADMSSQPARSLVAVDRPGPGVAGALLDRGVVVLRDLGGYLVALATAEDLETIDRLGLAVTLLHDDPTGTTFYVATPRRASAIDRFGTLARVYRHSPYGSVVEATPEQAEELAAEGVELARLFMTPMRAPALGRTAPRTAATTPDPVISELVDSVSVDRISADVQRLQDFVTRYSLGDSVLSARDWIAARFTSLGYDSVSFHQFNPSYGDNVVAVKPGVGNPEKVVLIGAHYDSVTGNHDNCPGADDNATGTACVLECARVLAPHLFDYTIVFVTFCGEEQGLVGSEAYAAQAEALGQDIVAAVNVDMIGYVAGGDDIDLDIVSNESSQWLRDLFMSTAALYVPSFAVTDGSLPGGANSDHASFWRHGYDAIMFWEDTGSYSPYIHSVNDIVGLSYNSPTLAVGSVRCAVALLATLADPFRVVVRHTPLENTGDTQGTYRVLADVLHASPLDPDSLYVSYTLTLPSIVGAVRAAPAADIGGYTAPLSWLGHGDAYEALIPPQNAGTVIDYHIVAVDENGFAGTHPRNAPAERHRFIVGTPTPMIVEDFETDTGWTAGAPGDDATDGFWVREVPYVVYHLTTMVVPPEDHTSEGINCFLTGNVDEPAPPGTADVDGGKTTLLSPVYDLSGMTNAWLSYYRWYTNDTGGNVDDQWRVDVSDDGGQTWVNIETLDTSERAWTRVQRFLPDLIALSPAVQLRFVAEDAGDPSVVEALVDDVVITQYTGAVTSSRPQALRATLGQNYPNPFNPRTTIRFTVTPPGAPSTLRVYDVAGRLVTTLVAGEHVSGERAVEWNGRDRFGNDVASGVYFYRLDAGSVTETRKMVVVR